MEGNRDEFNQPCVKIASTAELKQRASQQSALKKDACSCGHQQKEMRKWSKGAQERLQGKKCVCMKECNVISYIHGGQEIESFSVFEENKVIIFGMALRRFQTLQTKCSMFRHHRKYLNIH